MKYIVSFFLSCCVSISMFAQSAAIDRHGIRVPDGSVLFQGKNTIRSLHQEDFRSTSLELFSGNSVEILQELTVECGTGETLSLDASFSESGSLTKEGEGILILAAVGDNRQYTGNTDIKEGVVLLETGLSKSNIAVAADAVLQTANGVTILSLSANEDAVIDPAGILTVLENISLAGSKLIINSFSGTNDKIETGNEVTFSNINAIDVDFSAPGEYILISSVNGFTGFNADDFTVTLNGGPFPDDLQAELKIEGTDLILSIIDNGTNVTSVTLNNERYDGSPGYYLIDCGVTTLTITVETEYPNSVVLYKGTERNGFTVDNLPPGIHPVIYTVRSQNGKQQEYTIIVEKRFEFDEIIVQKWNNVLLVNNNSGTNGGYTFTAFKWFKDGEEIGTDSYYSAGDKKIDSLEGSSFYYAELTTEDGVTLRTCESPPTLRSAGVSVYPVPVKSGEVIRVETYLPEEQLANARLEVTGSSGSLMHQQQLAGEITDVRVSFTAGTYLFKVSAEGFEEIVKVIVK